MLLNFRHFPTGEINFTILDDFETVHNPYASRRRIIV